MKTRIQAKVKTRAKRSAIRGLAGDAIQIDVAVLPIDGRANLEVIRLIAELAGVPQSRVRIVLGQTHVLKLIEIDGIGKNEFLGRIE